MGDGSDMLKQFLAESGYRIYLFRSLVMLALAIVVFIFYARTGSSQQHHALTILAVLSIVAFLAQARILRVVQTDRSRLTIQLLPDLLLIGILIFLTSGIHSPFAFLIGLVIIAAGLYSDVILVLLFSIVGCVVYLISVYAFNLISIQETSVADTRHMLLQTSAYLLVGGVMAAIVQRHAKLWEKGMVVEQRHQSLQDLHSRAMATMREGMLVLGGDLLVHDSNAAAQHILGLEQSLIGQEVADIFPGLMGNAAFFPSSRRDAYQFEWERGEQVCLVTVTHLQRNDAERSWLLTLVDLSERRAMERRLNEQEKLAALGRMSAMLAHELRNPLQTIGQAVELLTTQKDPNGRLKGIVADEIHRLDRLVSDMLTYTAPMQPAREVVLADELVMAAIRQADTDGQREVRWQSNLKEITVDPTHFRLVLDNLLRNALVASPKPGTVNLYMHQENDRNERWILEVTDQGSGVDKSVREHLFEPFVRGRPGGTGLGLATVWQACRANNWEIDVDSTDAGTSFRISGDMKPVNKETGEIHG